MQAHIDMILLFLLFSSNYSKGLAFIIEENRKNMGIIGDESNSDLACIPFLFQSFRQVVPPLLKEDIIA
jgi:hypothetical protein